MSKTIGAAFVFLAILGSGATEASDYKYAYQCKNSLTGKSAGLVEFGNKRVKFDGLEYSLVDVARGAYHGKAAKEYFYAGSSGQLLTFYMVDDVKGVYVKVFDEEYVCKTLVR